MTTTTQKPYLPATAHDWALPLYDPLVRLLGIDATRHAFLDQAQLEPGQRVLDIGCGTGTLLVLLKSRYPDVEAVGLHPDPKALARAMRKARRAAVSIRVDNGFADELPYPAACFDRVLSSFMFHHVSADARKPALQEARRVLKPGGSFHMVDFGGPRAAAGSMIDRVLHSSHRLADNSVSRVLALMREAGFTQAAVIRESATLLGHMRVGYFAASVE
jgi:ubiquinone/menaquinone biosynthesis C-methylase UbiE